MGKESKNALAVACESTRACVEKIRADLKTLEAMLSGDLGEALRGEAAAVASWDEILERIKSGEEVNYRSVMPEFLSVGRLLLEQSIDKGEFARELEELLGESGAPGLLKFRESAGVCCSGADKALVTQAQLIVLRLLLTVHPRLLRLQVVDMDTMGGAMQMLAPFSDLMKSETIATGTDLEEHLEKLQALVQRRRTTTLAQYDWLWAYNEAHPEAAEAYTLVLLASGRKGMTRKAAELFHSLVENQNGAHAGVYFVVCDKGRRGDSDRNPEEKELAAIWKSTLGKLGHVVAETSKTELYQEGWLDTRDEGAYSEFRLKREEPSAEALQTLQECILKQAKKLGRPAVKTMVPEKDWWTGNSGMGIRVPIGLQSGAKIQEFVLGEDRTVFNALVGGAVGSGKTVLLNSIILNVASLYSPREVRLHLLDYKEGTEFSVYRRLPHVETLSIGPSVEFGLDVVESLTKELGNRAKKFKNAGVSNLQDYREVTGECLPRHLVVIDEFQVLWTDRTYGERASAKIEDLVRRGRSFGINFVLSTQSLRGANLSAATKSNLALRICMRLSEDDCIDFLGPRNAVPAGFAKAGEALYNENEGRVDGNRNFTASYLSGAEVARLVKRLHEKAEAEGVPTGNIAVYENDSYEDPDELLAEAGAGMLAVGRKTGLRGKVVALPLRGTGLRVVAVVGGDAEKRAMVMEGLLRQLNGGDAEVRELASGTLVAETERWQRWHGGEEPVDTAPSAYVLREADQVRDVRNQDVQNRMGAMMRNAPKGADALFLVSASRYQTIQALTGDFRGDTLSGRVFLDRESMLDAGCPNMALGETDGWWIGEGFELGVKVKLCGMEA